MSDFLLKLDNVADILNLNNGKSIVSYLTPRDYDNDSTKMNVSVGVASAITSYARIHMQQYLQNKDYNVYYTDTDSIVTDRPIDSTHIGKALGQMKLEYQISKGIFLAPKVY